jgi:UDP-2-acetamido-2,6-beta-L-arabino-hexul-4-ose reductase
MNILVMGYNGFLGKNLICRLKEYKNVRIYKFGKNDNINKIVNYIQKIDIVYYFIGVNRTKNSDDFYKVNVDFLNKFILILQKSKKNIKIIYTSSIKVKTDKVSLYSKSKLEAERILKKSFLKSSKKLIIYRLPNVFGKWCKPNYNSVVATFCYKISRKQNILVLNKKRKIELLYIDDFLSEMLSLLKDSSFKIYRNIKPVYNITLGELCEIINKFYLSRQNLNIDFHNNDFAKKLYSTFVSYLPVKKFFYKLNNKSDLRGNFMELLKMNDYGQISFFTVRPNKTRGNHYHNTKNEKFFIISGKAKFIHKNINTKKNIYFTCSDKSHVVIESIPGWAHNIKNVGREDLKVLLWSSEIFNKKKPDTINYEI